jgi:predicted secreted protein
MSKFDAYGSQFRVGTAQVETAVIVGTGNSASTLDVTTTAAGMTGTPILTNVTIVTGDSAAVMAKKVAVALNAVGNITALHRVEASGPNVILTKLVAIANDGTMNIAYTGGGTTPDATSNDTTAGVVVTTVAQVTSIGGPPLSADTIDVTTHDSTNAFEELVVGILRSGEATFDIVYDPADNTHDATDTGGLIYRMKNRIRSAFSVVFADTASTTWSFDGDVTGFEPSAAHDDSLTASVTVKLTGSIILV